MCPLACEEADTCLGSRKAGAKATNPGRQSKSRAAACRVRHSEPQTVVLTREVQVLFVFLEAKSTLGRGLAGSHLERNSS